ncbi:MAG: phenylalanine--tRNA ligase subunit alpha [Bacteroidales bacterium]|nr:phenylalanine--tRNA ligase subunit alpha [Bacteroidales bacterium]HOA08710.1 phenylalanine--tRNA ligase subunit alpha [Tenuifilaceae bacterium]HOC35454.1 phenylalanine--tRNA ligase subunit alpha [Tenuifilaceae bacterium]HOG71213.1 phenylalanine--tRNA ligase subunit alpha [Tenuifilaceae bacterium]HPG99261.1 phenylalanine--tRNA ligase subunit alpha [Tenuifilaceae bacterium]
MQEKINNILELIDKFTPQNYEEVESFRISLIGKKGELTKLFDDLKNLGTDEKKYYGKLLNDLKKKLNEKLDILKDTYKSKGKKEDKIDLTLQEPQLNFGTLHPITIVKNEIFNIFRKIGFSIYEGQEIEDDWHVFSALNFPPEHPARDMQDTFFIQKNPDVLLRTHTSSVQVRSMENEKLPIRVICPGRVFRNEAISSRAHCIFHQVEGLYIDKTVSFADLKQTLEFFVKEMFGSKTSIRLRPSYFPFTEPSAELDISCNLCGGKGCSVCKHTGWLEILGCGMVDPNVLELNNIDSKKYSGFAFGMGIERIAMLKFRVNDLRNYFENDIRFLNQFTNFY